MSEGNRLSLAFAGAFFGALLLGWYIIPHLRRLKYGQSIRAEMSAAHQAKQGTPTMGGIIFAIPAALAALLFAPRDGAGFTATLVAVFSAVGHGAVGFADDFVKIVRRRSLGLRARDKLMYQTFLGLGLAWAATALLNRGTAVWIPFTRWQVDPGPFGYYVFVLALVFGTVNAVNFTDGLDGLLGGASVIVFGFYTLVCLLLRQPGLAALSAATAAACAGFLRYNAHPARVFMGDVGAFFLGGVLAALAVLTRTELLVPLAGLLFVIEAASVILQVISFRLTGKRIFRMAPLHHHFDLAGWPETRTTRVFWVICMAGVVMAGWGLGPLLTP